LKGTVDSKHGVSDPEWEKTRYQVYDAGANLKAASGWIFRLTPTHRRANQSLHPPLPLY